MENTEKWVEKYKETMDKNKPSEKLMEQTLELMKHEIDSQRKGKKKCLFIFVVLVECQLVY